MTSAVKSLTGADTTEATAEESSAPFDAATEARPEDYMAVGTTFVTCTLGKVRVEWVTNLMTYRKLIGMKTQHKFVRDYAITDARNLAIHEATHDGSDYLLFWDDDIVPHFNTASAQLIVSMQAHPEIDVIAGAYPPRRDITEALVSKEEGKGMWWGWLDGKIHKVFFVGSAFMAIRLASLAKIEVPTYNIGDMPVKEWFYADEEITDDFYFARMCKKHDLGVYIHGGVTASQVDIEGNWFHIDIPEEHKPAHLRIKEDK